MESFDVLTKKGYFLHLNYSEECERLERVLGQFEVEKFEYLKNKLDKQTVFIDIGSCYGDFSFYAASRCKHVVIVEPSSSNINWIRKAHDRNKITNATILQVAVSDHLGTESFSYFAGNGNHGQNFLTSEMGEYSLRNNNMLSEIVSVVDLNYFQYFVNGHKSIIKMDIEGLELKVLKHGIGFLKINKPTILLDVHGNIDVNELTALFSGIYTIFDVKKNQTTQQFRKNTDFILEPIR